MDRIEFVESLEKKLEEVTAKRDVLNAEKNKAYRRTFKCISEKFNKSNDHNDLVFFASAMSRGDVSMSYQDMIVKYGTDYSIDKVIDLGHSIRTIEKECIDLQNTINAYNSDSSDLISYIKKELAND